MGKKTNRPLSGKGLLQWLRREGAPYELFSCSTHTSCSDGYAGPRMERSAAFLMSRWEPCEDGRVLPTDSIEVRVQLLFEPVPDGASPYHVLPLLTVTAGNVTEGNLETVAKKRAVPRGVVAEGIPAVVAFDRLQFGTAVRTGYDVYAALAGVAPRSRA